MGHGSGIHDCLPSQERGKANSGTVGAFDTWTDHEGNAKRKGATAVRLGDRWLEEIAIPIWMAEGENQHTLQYSTHSPFSEDNSKRAVLFRKIALLSPEQDGSNPQAGYAKPQHDSGSFVPPVRESSPARAAVKERQTSPPPVAVPSL